MRHFLTALLIKLAQVQSEQMVGGEDTAVDDSAQLFQQFTSLLEEQFKRMHSVQDYATALHITPRRLSRITQKYLGQTAKSVIEDRLILEAKRYLDFTNLTVKEIAFTLGYKDPSYFSKSFKKQTGVTPQSYR